MKRIFFGLALLIEIAIAAVFAMFIGYGRLDQNVFVFVYIFGIALAVAIATAWALPPKILSKLAVHGALLVGCIVFAIPFVWLITTSFKYTEEVFKFPPKWVPTVPADVRHSPYITAEEFDAVERPDGISAERWKTLWPSLEQLIWQKGMALLGDRVQEFGSNVRVSRLQPEWGRRPRLPSDPAPASQQQAKSQTPNQESNLRTALVEGLWDQISTSIPVDIWKQPTADIQRAVSGRIDADRVDAVWPRISRTVSLRDITVQDDALVEQKISTNPIKGTSQFSTASMNSPVASDLSPGGTPGNSPSVSTVGTGPVQGSSPVGTAGRDTNAAPASMLSLWKPLTDNVRLRPSKEPVHLGEGGTPLVVEYDLDKNPKAIISADLPLPFATSKTLATKSLFSLTLPMRQDRSWHGLRVELEMDGKRYIPEDRLYLGYHRWQDLTFKFGSKDNRDERNVGIYRLWEENKRPSDFREPGKVRIILTIEQASHQAAVWRKLTANYHGAYISMPNRWHYLKNSIYLVVLTVLGHVLSCSLVAYSFARLRWPGRNIFFGILLASMMLPGQVTMIPVFLIYKHIGWYNTLKTLWVPSFFGGAFFIFLLRQFMKTIPAELEEAAKIDGCSFFGIYWRIMLPLLKPALAAVAIFTFMNTWNDFMGPLIYLNDQRLYPLALGLFDLRTEQGAEYGTLMAASTLMTLPVVALFFVAQRFFIQGITLTGMKG